MHVESDHKSLKVIIIIVKKPLATAPPRLQKTLFNENAKSASSTLEYKPEKEFKSLPDIQCTACTLLPETTDDNMEKEIVLHVHLVHAQSSLAISKPKLEEIQEETKIVKDQLLGDLSEIIKSRSPKTKAETQASILIYSDIHCKRLKLSELNSIVLEGERIHITTSTWKNMPERIHQNHEYRKI